MRRALIAVLLALTPALASAQVLPGSPFSSSSGTGALRITSCPVQTLSTTSATNQTVATITTTTASAGIVWLFSSVTASDGSAVDSEGSMTLIAWNNLSGTASAAITATIGPGGSDGSGTLSVSPNVSAATNVVSIKVQPSWTTIVPTSVKGYSTFITSGIDPVVCQ